MIADDHQMFSDGLVSIFQHDDEIQIVGIASDGKALLDLLAQKSTDVVLMDLSMPTMNGEEASQEILQHYPDVKIIVLTMHHTSDVVLPLVDLGVHGFMLKNSGKSELKTAIAKVMEGQGYFSSEIIQIIHKKKNNATNEIKITRREKEILELIHEGYLSSDIAEKLFISPYTVETHRRNLLNKTDTRNATQLINRAIEMGWIRVRPRL